MFVSAANHGFSALEYLSDFPLSGVGEIDLAGHSEQSDDEGDCLIIDSHDGPVGDAVWKLYEIVIARAGPLSTLIEWDSSIPEWPFRAVTGLEVKDFHLLVRLKVFNTEQMNQAVFAFRRYEDASLRYTGIESHGGLTHYGLYDTVVGREFEGAGLADHAALRALSTRGKIEPG